MRVLRTFWHLQLTWPR